ncbi:MAG: class I SAM-dependent methyltransferase [Gammaproteobacteria bacterium]|nr:class I SAM-dependent methyltransferase [Gammaproteobacteria bacterium]
MTFEEICIQRYGDKAPAALIPNEVEIMRASSHPFARLMASVLEDVITDNVAADEAPHIAAIEARRTELEGSEAEITYLDYGAATKYAEQTAEEMYQGVERARSLGAMSRRSSKPYRGALLLLKLLRQTQPEHCLELGSGVGITAAYQAAALELNGHGHLVTLEGPASIAAVAEATIAERGHGRVSVQAGRWQDTLEAVLAANQPIDFAFIDGHHDRDASLGYFEAILPALSEGAVLILDDIRWSQGMLEAWTTISAHPRVEVSVDLVDTGLVYITGAPQRAEHHKLT